MCSLIQTLQTAILEEPNGKIEKLICPRLSREFMAILALGTKWVVNILIILKKLKMTYLLFWDLSLHLAKELLSCCLQPRCPSADEWIRKLQDYMMEYYSAIKKNALASVVMRWMKLEPIAQSEVSQKEKHQYSILMHIYGVQKDGNDDPICETAKETQI